MVDISKCEGKGCPLAASCFRYTSTADPYWQYWIEEPYDEENETCPYFILDRRLVDEPRKKRKKK